MAAELRGLFLGIVPSGLRGFRSTEAERRHKMVGKEKRCWRKMTDAELLQYWEANYRESSPGRLALVDPGFYRQLRKRKLLRDVWDSYRQHVERQLLPSISKALEEYAGAAGGQVPRREGSVEQLAHCLCKI